MKLTCVSSILLVAAAFNGFAHGQQPKKAALLKAIRKNYKAIEAVEKVAEGIESSFEGVANKIKGVHSSQGSTSTATTEFVAIADAASDITVGNYCGVGAASLFGIKYCLPVLAGVQNQNGAANAMIAIHSSAFTIDCRADYVADPASGAYTYDATAGTVVFGSETCVVKQAAANSATMAITTSSAAGPMTVNVEASVMGQKIPVTTTISSNFTFGTNGEYNCDILAGGGSGDAWKAIQSSC